MSDAKHILVIDDEADIREVVELSLHLTAGWRVTQGTCGEHGLALARGVRPDCILLDVMMPELDGFATLRLLREDLATRRIPVILVTAKGTPDLRARAAEAGARGVILKPFDPMRLSAEVAALLRWDGDAAPPPSAPLPAA